MTKSTPHYDWGAFVTSCNSIRNKINIWPVAKLDAKNVFNLKTKDEILDFIVSGGLENLTHFNTTTWDDNPFKNKHGEILIDAYTFVSGYQDGYIAIFFSPETHLWQIKSFHEETQSSSRMVSLSDAFLKNMRK